jgi:hypothetical protein
LERFPFDVNRGSMRDATDTAPPLQRADETGPWQLSLSPALLSPASATTGTESPAGRAGEGATGARAPTPQPMEGP